MKRFAFGMILAVISAGCCPPIKARPDYNRALPPGACGLRELLNTSDWPDLESPWNGKDENLTEALGHSLQWFSAASTTSHFPICHVTHPRAQASVYAFMTLLNSSASASEFEKAIHEQFTCYTSVGYDDRGSVLFTGYYSPIFKAGKTGTGAWKYPLYQRPADLVSDPLTGRVLGRAQGNETVPYPARREIESSNMLAGQELVWLNQRLDQYVIQVNGSAKLEMDDGSTLYIGYAGNNGHAYTGLGQTLLKEGVLEPERLSLPAIRDYFRDKPQELERYIVMNDRYVFFKEYTGDTWPAGSLGVRVSPFRSLATDKEVFPRGGVLLADTTIASEGSAQRKFSQFMLDQDTGGAIRAAGRADIYMGIGPEAEKFAGRQFAKGRLYYFFLRQDQVIPWLDRLKADPAWKGKPKVAAI